MFGLFKKKPKPAANQQMPEPKVEQIVPRFKTENFAKTLKDVGVPDDQMPPLDHFAGGLYLTYSLDVGHSYMSVTNDTLEELGIKREDLRGHAIQNLSNNLPELQVNHAGSLHQLSAGGNVEATLLLVEGLWTEFFTEFPGGVVACAPHRDALFFCDAKDEDAIEEMKRICQEILSQDDTHGLVADLLWRVDGGWEVRP